MKTTNLNPEVYRKAAALLNEERYFSCDCIGRALSPPDCYIFTSEVEEHLDYFKLYFKPEDTWRLGWWEGNELEPRKIALLLCADILESEQKKQRDRRA